MDETRICEGLFEWGIKSFALVGFDDEGNEVRVFHAKSDMEEKALRQAYDDWTEEDCEVEFEAEGDWLDDDDSDEQEEAWKKL